MDNTETETILAIVQQELVSAMRSLQLWLQREQQRPRGYDVKLTSSYRRRLPEQLFQDIQQGLTEPLPRAEEMERTEVRISELRDTIAQRTDLVSRNENDRARFLRNVETLRAVDLSRDPLAIQLFDQLKSHLADQLVKEEVQRLKDERDGLKVEIDGLKRAITERDGLISQQATMIAEEIMKNTTSEEKLKVRPRLNLMQELRLELELEEGRDAVRDMRLFLSEKKPLSKGVLEWCIDGIKPGDDDLGIAQTYCFRVLSDDTVDKKQVFESLLPFANERPYSTAMSRVAADLLQEPEIGIPVLDALLAETGAMPKWLPTLPLHYHPQYLESYIKIVMRGWIPPPTAEFPLDDFENLYDWTAAKGIIEDSMDYALELTVNGRPCVIYKYRGRFYWKDEDWVSVAEDGIGDGRVVVNGRLYQFAEDELCVLEG